jgi:hypothetical protein
MRKVTRRTVILSDGMVFAGVALAAPHPQSHYKVSFLLKSKLISKPGEIKKGPQKKVLRRYSVRSRICFVRWKVSDKYSKSVLFDHAQ